MKEFYFLSFSLEWWKIETPTHLFINCLREIIFNLRSLIESNRIEKNPMAIQIDYDYQSLPLTSRSLFPIINERIKSLGLQCKCFAKPIIFPYMKFLFFFFFDRTETKISLMCDSRCSFSNQNFGFETDEKKKARKPKINHI